MKILLQAFFAASIVVSCSSSEDSSSMHTESIETPKGESSPNNKETRNGQYTVSGTNKEKLLNDSWLKYYANDVSGALIDLTRLIESNPKYVEAYHSRSMIYIDQQKYGSAKYDLDKIIEIDPSFVDAYIERGKIHWIYKEIDLMCNDFNTGISLMTEEDKENYGVSFLENMLYNCSIR